MREDLTSASEEGCRKQSCLASGGPESQGAPGLPWQRLSANQADNKRHRSSKAKEAMASQG